MGKISTYVIDGTISNIDKVIGTDGNDNSITKNFTIGDLVSYFAVAIGDHLVPYQNATEDVNLGFFDLYANNVRISNRVIVNGDAGLPGQVLMSQGPSFPAAWGYAIGTQTLQNVLNQGNIGGKSIILDNTSNRLVADIDGVYSSSANIYLRDKSTGDTGQFYVNKISLSDSSLSRSSEYDSDSILYRESVFGNSVTVKPVNYNNQTFLYPNVGGAFVMSINGEFADLSGNIVLDIPAPGAAIWGAITGTLSNQSDLQSVLNSKFNTPSGTTLQYVRGDGSLATFPTIPSITPSALTKVDDTNVTLTLGGSPSNALLQAVSLTLGWTGTLADSRIASASTWNAKLSDAPSDGNTYGRKNAAWVSIPTQMGDAIYHGTASGTDTYTVTISGPTAYNDGDAYLIRFTNGNTTGCTLNINGLGAIPLYRNNDGPLLGGDIANGGEMLCIYDSTALHFQVIGISPNSLIAYITNDDSVTITKGQAVYAFSGQGDRMTVKLANNVGDATSAQTVGLVLSTSIAPNQKGFIMMQGLLDGLSILPTATWSDGDAVYLGATPGSITNVKPSAPNHLVYLGIVTTASNGSAGRLYVRVQNGYELQELHNVALTNPPANNDGLFYETSTSLWKNKSIPTVLGYTPVNPTRAINTTSPLSGGGDLSADRTLSIAQATSSASGFLSSTDWSRFANFDILAGYQALGSSFKSILMANPSINAMSTAAQALTSTQLRMSAVYVPIGATITGVRWWQGVQGAFTPSGENRVALFSYSGGTLTNIAQTINSDAIWETAAANSWASAAFTAPVSISAGIYFVGALFNGGATVPTIGVMPNTLNANMLIADFTNAAKLNLTVNSQTTMPSSVSMSGGGVAVSNINFAFYLY